VVFDDLAELPPGAGVPTLARRHRQTGREDGTAQHVAHDVHVDAVGQLGHVLGNALTSSLPAKRLNCFWSMPTTPNFSSASRRSGLPEQNQALWPSERASMRSSSETPPPKPNTLRVASRSRGTLMR